MTSIAENTRMLKKDHVSTADNEKIGVDTQYSQIITLLL